MVNINEEQITRLKTQAEQFGWVDSQQFKDKVNTQYWAGSYDKLVNNVAGSIQSWAIQGNMENANKIAPTPAPAPAPTEPVWTKIEPQTPTLPAPTPIPTETVKTESITTPKPTNLWSIQGKNIMNEAPEFKGADGQTYKTVRFDDGSLGTVKVWEGWVNELVWNTYKDEQRADMKQIVEQWLNNADNIYNNLLRWQVLPEVVKTTNNYVKAQNRFNQYNQFKNLNQSQYQQLLAQGKLIPGTQAYNDLMNDPVAKSNIIKAQNLNAINQNQKAEEKIASTENNQSDVILSNNPTVAQALEDGSLSVEEYQSLTNTPDIAEKSKNVSKLKEEYIKLKSDYDAVEDDVNAELSGKWLSTSYINAKISERRKSLYKWLSLAEQLYSSAMWELTTMKNDATALLNTNLSLYKEQQARQFQLEDRQYQEDLATRAMQQQYDYQFWDFNSEDPRIRDTAIRNAVAQLYTQYPIPGMEAPAVKEQKVKALMAQGLTGQQAISQLEQEIRSTNRYKQMIAWDNKFWFQNIWDWTIAVTDPSTGQVKFESIQNVWTWITREQATSTYGSTPAVRNFNPWNIMDTWFGWQKVQWERFTRFNTPQEWFSALIAKIQNIQSGNSKVYSPNMTILEYISKYAPASDNNNPQAYANAIAKDLWVPVNSKIWELDPVKLASAHAKHEDRNSYKMLLDLWVITTDGSLWTPQATENQYNQDKIELLAEISQIQSETEKRKALEGAGLTLQDLTRYKADSSAGKIPPTQAQIQAALWTISDIQWLAQTDWTDATGKFDYTRLIWTPDATDAGVLIENLKNKSAFNNLGMLKWPMSDKDLWFLQNVSSKLDPVQSNAQFEKNIVEMYNIAARKAWIKEITKLSEIPKDRILPWQQNTWTSTENAYNASNGKTYKIVINPN